MDDLDIDKFIETCCIECKLPYDLCQCELEYPATDEDIENEEAAQQSVQRTGGNVCPLCGLECGDAPVHENCAAANR